MAETPTKTPKAWTDTEKVGLMLQIITRAGTIPWDDIELPEGRTKKACVVMIDKEKTKVKKALEAVGKSIEPTPKGKAKRKADEDVEIDSPGGAGSAKRATGRKKAEDVKVYENDADGEESTIKAEPEVDASE